MPPGATPAACPRNRRASGCAGGRTEILLYRGSCGSQDLDGDGVSAVGSAGSLPGDLTDCNDADAFAFAAPPEVASVLLTDPGMIAWSSAAPSSGGGTLHDVLRGAAGQYPVGAGSSEACLLSGTSGTIAQDSSVPPPGSAFYYLARARNGCGTGTYGAASSGATRISTACP